MGIVAPSLAIFLERDCDDFIIVLLGDLT